jgi:hypothetical protein
MWIAYSALMSAWDSARQVETELSHRVFWSFIQEIVRTAFPDRPEMHLPDEPTKGAKDTYARNT